MSSVSMGLSSLTCCRLRCASMHRTCSSERMKLRASALQKRFIAIRQCQFMERADKKCRVQQLERVNEKAKDELRNRRHAALAVAHADTA